MSSCRLQEEGILDVRPNPIKKLRWKSERDMIPNHLQKLFLAGIKGEY